MNDTLPFLIALVSLIACVVLALRLRAENARLAPIPSIDPTKPGLLRSRSGAMQILERMNEGVLVLDDGLKPTFANQAARRLLGMPAGPLPVRLPAVEVTHVAAGAGRGSEPTEALVETYYPRRLSLRVEATKLEDEGTLVVLQDVTEEVRTQRVRREFVAHASHELKSPVASLQTLGDALVEAIEHSDTEASRRFSGKLLKELDRMGKLVGDLLDLSRLEDPSELPGDPCDVTAVAREALADLEAVAHDAGHILEHQLDNELWVKGDPQQLGLLIRNLLENAVQYTPERGRISVEVKGAGDVAEITVSDDGIGIPLEAQTRIFERFYRVDRARSRDRGGTGLGLAIVKHVAELHGGTVELHSELGQGSTFTVRIPLLEPVRDAAVNGRHPRDKETA
jgi:signal transduction histidine kinase